MTARRRKALGGRPPKPASEKQGERVLLSLTRAERAALARVAGDEPLGGYVRRLVIRHALRRGALKPTGKMKGARGAPRGEPG